MEWRSTSLRLIGPVDGAQVEVVHHLADDVHRVVRAYRVQCRFGIIRQRGREQERLVGCVRVLRSHAKRITRTILRLNRQAPRRSRRASVRSGWRYAPYTSSPKATLLVHCSLGDITAKRAMRLGEGARFRRLLRMSVSKRDISP